MSAERKRDEAAEVGAKAAAALMGSAIAGPAGAVAAAALEPLLKNLIIQAWQEIGLLRQRSVGVMVQEAADHLEISPQELVEKAWESTEKTQLFADAMYQAAQTFNSKKIRALARAVANGLRDDEARPDEEMLIVNALSDVEEAHIKVLQLLSGHPSLRYFPTQGASLETIAGRASLSRASAEHVLAELIRTGMVHLDNKAAVSRQEKVIAELQQEANKLRRLLENPEREWANRLREVDEPGEIPGAEYVISEFGGRCLDYLSDAAQELDQQNQHERPK